MFVNFSHEITCDKVLTISSIHGIIVLTRDEEMEKMDLQKLVDEMAERERKASKRFLKMDFNDDAYDYYEGASDVWGVALNLVKRATGLEPNPPVPQSPPSTPKDFFTYGELGDEAKERVYREAKVYLEIEFGDQPEILADLHTHTLDECEQGLYDAQGHFERLR